LPAPEAARLLAALSVMFCVPGQDDVIILAVCIEEMAHGGR
jgi:hypothetical protein